MKQAAAKILTALLLAAGMAGLSACEKNEEMGPDVLITVNGDPIRTRDLQMAWAVLPEAEQEKYSGAQGIKKLLDEMITWKLMAQEAERKRLDEEPAVKERIDMIRQQILVNALLDRTITDADLFRYYQENFIGANFILQKFPEQATPAQKAQARDRAAAIYEELKGGADFEDVARMKSEASNAAAGGIMGYVTHETIVNMAGFNAAEATFALKAPREFTQPVEGNKGYYIFQLVEPRKNLDPSGLTDELKDALRDLKREQIIRSYSNELNTRQDNVIVTNNKAVNELFSELQQATEAAQGTTAQPGATPAPGASLEPGATASPGAAPPAAGNQ